MWTGMGASQEAYSRREAKDGARGDVIFYRLLGPVDGGIGPRQEALSVVTLSGPSHRWSSRT